jgi:uncharacterized membrane protein
MQTGRPQMKRGSRAPASRIATLTLLILPTCALGHEFFGLGSAPRYLESTGYGLSSNGTTIVGSVAGEYPILPKPFRWTRGGGFELLAVPPNSFDNFGARTNWDGSIVIGTSASRPRRWRNSSTFEDLSPAPITYSFVRGISDDGRIAVGTLNDPEHPPMPTVWRSGSSVAEPLPSFPGSVESYGTGVSGDGETIVGVFTGGSGNQRAFKWSARSGYSLISSSFGGSFFTPNDASFDGSVVVGTVGSRAFAWDENGAVRLPGLRSEALAVSGDGRTIVGSAGGNAVFWIDHQIFRLDTYLAARGQDLTGWHLQRISDVSSNGEVMCGTGLHNGVSEAFYFSIPSPAGVMVFGMAGLLGSRRRERQ